MPGVADAIEGTATSLLQERDRFVEEHKGKVTMDFGLGITGSAAVTMGGVTIGIEVSGGFTDRFDLLGCARQKCFQCNLTTRPGLGIGDIGIGLGLLGSVGDATFTGEGATVSNGIGFALGDVSAGFQRSVDGYGKGWGVSGVPPGLSLGVGANFFLTATFTGKVCEDVATWDFMGWAAQYRLYGRIDEAFAMAWKAGEKEFWGYNFNWGLK